MTLWLAVTCAALLTLLSGTAYAHAFGVMYTLPIPLWMYVYGAAATLIVSFAVIGYLIGMKSTQVELNARTLGSTRKWTVLPGTARIISVGLFLFTILTGLIGNQNPLANFSMTFFWIVFALGFTYLTALCGNLYLLLSPWRAICDWTSRIWPHAFSPRLTYPKSLAYWPAFVLYLGFIWIELFGNFSPRALAFALATYSVLTFLAARLFGRETWFRYGEFFGVFFCVISKMAPLAYETTAGARRLKLQWPFIGLLREPPEHMSLLVFVLFMLSSTAFDGIHETTPWVSFFWRDIWPCLMPLAEAATAQPYAASVTAFYAWQAAALALTPFFYLAIYVAFVALTRRAAGSALSLRQLALRFAYTLVPIALVYNVAHYYTLLFTEGPSLVRLVSDPFGVGWDILGTRNADLAFIPSAGAIWHTQVGLILLGHIISVYLAHLEALRLFSAQRRAIASQIPMLILMVVFTTVGLGILSLPIEGGHVLEPPVAQNE